MSAQLAVRLTKTFRGRAQSQFTLDVEFTVDEGVTIVFGPSGSGKTTLLDCVAGLQTPDRGEVRLRAEDSSREFFCSDSSVNVAPGERKIGYVFQQSALFPHMSVRQNVAFGLAGPTPRQRDERVTAALERFHIAKLAEARPATLSGGERQRVALARTLVTDPALVLLDEPFTALDQEIRFHLIDDFLRALEERPVPVLYVTHAVDEACALGRHAVVLENGRVVQEGDVREVLSVQRKRLVAVLS